MASSGPRLPPLTARVEPAPWPGDHPLRLYSTTDVLRLSPPSTVHVSAWARSYTVSDTVLDMCWATFDRDRMLCIAMPDALRIITNDGRSFTVPFAAEIRSVWPLADGLLVDFAGRVRYLRHPLEIDQDAAAFRPEERCVFVDDGVLVSYEKGRAWLWTSTVGERGDDDDSSGIRLERAASVMLAAPLSKVFLSTDADGVRIICCQSVMKSARLDLYSMTLQYLFTIHSIDSVSIDGICQIGSVRHRDLVVLGHDRRLSLWIYSSRICNINTLQISDISYISDGYKSRFIIADLTASLHESNLTPTFKSPLTQLCFDTLRCTGWIPARGLYALLAQIQDRSRHWRDDFSVFSELVCSQAVRQSASSEQPASSWECLLQSEYHHRQVMLPLYAFAAESASPPDVAAAESALHLTDYTSAIMDSLHLLYESLKLDSMSVRHLRPLAALLCCMATQSARTNYIHHYVRDFPDLLQPEIDPRTPSDPSRPLHLLSYLLSCLHSTALAPPDFPHGPDLQSPLTNAVRICQIFAAFPDPEHVLLRMVQYGLRHSDLNTLPFGVALPLRAVLRACRQAPRPSWPPAAFILIERTDLCPGLAQTVTDEPQSVDADDADGTLLVAERARWRFARDYRALEACRLLRSSVVLRMTVPDWTLVQDQDPAQLHQKQLADLAERILAAAVGRAMFTMASIQPIITEPLPIPPLTLAARTHPGNVLVRLDEARLPDDWACWPAFHNGFAAGLRVRPCTDRAVHRAWIVYNRPAEPTHAHAGVLLALGLHGHLGGLARADLYWYLSKKHAPTTMAVVLGLAASERSSQSSSVTKTLALHIPALLPAGVGPDLEIPVLVQACALIGIGLVYQGTANRLMTEMLLTEIGRRPTPHVADHREAYALSAGLGLGLVTLGLGDNAVGLSDLGLADRLTKLMLGGAADPGVYEPIRSNVVKEGDAVNVAVTGPGAILALGLMYLRTGDVNIAARLALPITLTDLADLHPDQIALRVACRALVLWDQIVPAADWVQAQIPDALRCVYDDLRTDFDLAHCQAVAGACLALGLRFAGTANAAAAAVLGEYVRWTWAQRERRRADRGALDDGLAAAVLALAVVMSGTGHLQTFTLLRSFRVPFRPGMSYGLHMALHMAIGFLFLGGGRYAVGNGNGHVAALLPALWPRWPRSVNDNRYHMQMLRHLYVLGVTARYLDTRDIDTGRPVLVPVEIETDPDAETLSVAAPCLLPDLDSIKTLRVASPRFWNVTVQFKSDDVQVRQIRDRGVLFVKRRTGHLPYLQDPRGRLGVVARTFPRNPSTARDLVQSLSADAILAAFAKNLCADPGPLGTFCGAVLYDCLVRDAPEMLATYLQIRAALVDLARRPTCTLPLWQLKFVLRASGTAALLQAEFVCGLRAGLNAMFADSERYGRLLRAWVRGERPQDGTDRVRFALFLTAFDLPSAQALREFASGAIPAPTLIPQLSDRFPDLNPTALAHLESALRPLINIRPT